jgi:hypothetical protein
MDRFSRICLVLVVLLLAVIALRPVVLPQSTQANTTHKYIAVHTGTDGNSQTIQATLDKYALEGWDLIAAIPVSEASSSPILIFQQ